MENENNTITKKLCSAEVYKTLKYYNVFLYIGFFASFFLPMLAMLDKQSAYIAMVISALAFVFGIWRNKKSRELLNNRYRLE